MSAWEPRQLAQQIGRTFVITGGNSGIGLETARDLVGRGATVVLACRDRAKAERAAEDVSVAGKGSATVMDLDLADLDSVAAFAKDLAERVPALTALVCNAGIMGGPLGLTAQGFERQMGTNHLGHAALVSAVWPLLHAAGGRVVMVSSIAARGGRLTATTTREELVSPASYSAHRVYSNTKQANLLFSQELHRRAVAAGSPVSSVAAHPGVSSTNLFPRLLDETAGVALLKPVVRPVAAAVHKIAFQTAQAGALPTLRALHHSTPSGSFVGPGGLGQVRGRPELVDVYATGRDPQTAANLWRLTEGILGAPLPLSTGSPA